MQRMGILGGCAGTAKLDLGGSSIIVGFEISSFQIGNPDDLALYRAFPTRSTPIFRFRIFIDAVVLFVVLIADTLGIRRTPVKKIKQWLEEVRNQKHVHSDDLEKIIRRCLQKYSYLFPRYDCRKNGSRSVHHFNVAGVPPISLERPHGGREYVPRAYVALALGGLDSLVAFIEMYSKGELYDDETNSEGRDFTEEE